MTGAFNPFTFMVIIDIYDPITIYFFSFGFVSVGLFFLLCFLSREVPLAFAKAGLVVLNSLHFCFCKAFDISFGSDEILAG